MSKRSVVILVAIAVVALILVVTVSTLLSSPSQITQKAAGIWQEIGESPAYTMQVVYADSTYLITYPRWRYDRESFVLQGDELLGGGGENSTNEMVKTITYDDDSDQLTISDSSGDYRYTFERLARPSGVVGVMREAGGPIGVRRQPNTLIELHWRSAFGPVAASTTSDENGAFKITVAPGDYWVVPVAEGDELVVADQVTVQPGAYATAKPFFSVR
jgi:hypothetical protein